MSEPIKSEESKIEIPKGFSLEKLDVSKDWFEEREKILVKARVFSSPIDSAEVNAEAAKVLKEITKTLKKSNSCRLDITRPLDQIKKAVMTAYKDANEPLEKAQDWIKNKIAEFAKAEETKRIEAKKKFEAEQAAKVEEQFAEHVQETPDAEFVPVVDMPKTQIRAEKTVDTVITKSIDFEIIDPMGLPKQFLKPDEVAIRASLREFKDYYMEKCEGTEGGVLISNGLKIFIKTSVKSR